MAHTYHGKARELSRRQERADMWRLEVGDRINEYQPFDLLDNVNDFRCFCFELISGDPIDSS